MQETQETQIQSLGWEDPLEKEKATHSSILTWRIPWTEESCGLQSTGLHRVRHDWSDLGHTWAFRIMSKTYFSGLNACVPLNSCEKSIFQGDGNRRWRLCPHEWDSSHHKRGAHGPLGPSAMWEHHVICKLAEGSHLHLLAGSLPLGLSASRTMRNKFLFIQFSSVAQLCPTLWDPMDCNTPGLPVHHQLPEFTQTHVCWVGDAIQPSHPLSAPSPPALNLSQHQDLFKWVSSSHQVAKVLEFQLQYQSFQWPFRTDSL